VSAWTLASSGRHAHLALGQTSDEVMVAFGEPTATAHHIWKYDVVELDFTEGELWLIHCEFGEAALPAAVVCSRLELEPEGREWPLARASLLALIDSAGFTVEFSTQRWGEQFRFGFATVSLDEDDGLVSWGIHRPGAAQPS
jgi:hypothetical protein